MITVYFVGGPNDGTSIEIKETEGVLVPRGEGVVIVAPEKDENGRWIIRWPEIATNKEGEKE